MTTRAKLIATIGFDDRRMMLFAIPVLSFVIPLIFFGASLQEGLWSYLHKWGSSLMHTVGYWLVMRAIFIRMRRRFPGFREVGKRLLYTTLLICVAFVILERILGVLHRVIFWGEVEGPDMSQWNYALVSFLLILLIGTLYESVFLYSRWRESIVETERLRRENVESQLEGLRSQVNPHFLFNSLNTLSYVIPEDPPRAVRFVQMLSRVYRYILEIRDKKTTTLEEELDFLDAYVFLLQERFGNNLHIERRVPAHLQQHQIVPLSLQILFENAIKHNIISSDRPLTIEVFEQAGKLVVRNNLQRKKQTMLSTQVGLPNIRSRYAFFTNDTVDVEETDQYFAVHLPLLKIAVPA